MANEVERTVFDKESGFVEHLDAFALCRIQIDDRAFGFYITLRRTPDLEGF